MIYLGNLCKICSVTCLNNINAIYLKKNEYFEKLDTLILFVF